MTLLLSSPDGVEFNKLEEYVNVLMESMKRDDHCHEECRLVLTFNQTDLNKAIQSAQRNVGMHIVYMHVYYLINVIACIYYDKFQYRPTNN